MRKIVGAIIFLFLPVLSHAQCTGSSPTWTSTPDQASLSACVSKAVAGDTINVSAGTATWSTAGIATSKAISIVGAGPGSTVINDAIPTSASPSSIFQLSPTVVGSLTRLSGMTLQPAAGTATVSPAISAQGRCSGSGCTNLRIDHITFSGWGSVTKNGNSYGICAIGDMFGVIDHNIINGNADGTSGGGGYLQFAEINNGSYQGIGLYGDNSWAQPENYGSANFLYFENNTFNAAGCCENEGNASGGYNSRGGGRIVARFNTFNLDLYNFALGWHGTETNGRPRSGRAAEFYANDIVCQGSTVGGTLYGCGQAAGLRGGSALVWGNSTNIPSALLMNTFFTLTTYRTQGSINWGACDGSSVWDTNDGVTYWSGTIASVSGSGPYTITVSGTSPGWTSNQWSPNGAPYSVHDVTKLTGSEITANGANTLTLSFSGGPGAWAPAVGDVIQILRATVCIDQAGGRGAGALYSGATGNAPASPVAAANEVSSPTYLWANLFPGKAPSSYMGSNTGRIINNRDWYQDSVNQAAQSSPTSPFNGNSGTGHGTLANRPASCKAGTAYWATDQGTWNTTGATVPGTSGSPQGELFICGASGWPATASYIPYTYPHPLINGGGTGTAGNPPNPPAGLTATVQ
jgi:hypothetical protein